TDDMPDAVRLANDIVAQDLSRARGRSQERGQDPQGGGFARAVGPDEAKQVTFIDDQIETGKRSDVSVHSGQAESLDCGYGRGVHLRIKYGLSNWSGLNEKSLDRDGDAPQRVAMGAPR